METFTTPPAPNQTAYFAEHTGTVNKVVGTKHNQSTIVFLFKTHVLFKRKKDVEGIVKEYNSIEEVFDAEQKPVKKFFGIISNLSNLFSVLSALPVIFKVVIVILGLAGIGGGTFFSMFNKKPAPAPIVTVAPERHAVSKSDYARSVGLKYNIQLGKYKDLRGYTIVVYDILEDKEHRQVWVYSYDQYGKYFCDTFASFHQVLDYKYAGKRQIESYYSKIKD